MGGVESAGARGGLDAQLAALEAAPLPQLRAEWERLTGRPPPPGLRRDLLMRALAYKPQERALVRAMVRAVVTKMIVGRDRITISLARAALLARLRGRRADGPVAEEKGSLEAGTDEPDAIELVEKVTWRRRGRVTTLVLPADGRGADPAPNDALR